MYNGLHVTKCGGRNRDNMYKDSLASIAECGLPIYCYVFPEHVEELQKYFNDKNLTNVSIIGHDILSEDYHTPIMAIKESNPNLYFNNIFWQQRCPEVMYGKTRMLQRVIQSFPQYEKIYWIDAGLSSSSILRHKFFPFLSNDKHYISSNFFTKELFDNLDVYTKDGMFAAFHTRPNNLPIPEKYNKTPYSIRNAMIGGLFGGNVLQMKQFCELFETYIQKMLENKELYAEESAYTGIANDHPELFNPITFDTFYNEDWGKIYNSSEISFAQIFDNFLGTK
jgi:hypothetical protein